MSDDELCGETKNNGEECTFPAKYPDGKCGHHTDEGEPTDGKQSLLEKDQSIIELVAGMLQNGDTIGEALAEAQVARGTHDGWMAKGKQEDSKEVYQKYRSEVTQAREIGKKSDRSNLERKCAEEGDTRTLWKIHKEKYGDLYDGESGGGDETTVVIHDNEQSYREKLQH